MLEKIIKNKAIYAIASIVIGIFMIIKGGSLAADVIRIIGWMLIGMGVIYAAAYFFGKDRDEVQLGYAVMAGIGGMLLVLLAGIIVGIFPIIAGIVLIVNGIANYTGANQGDPDAYSRGTAVAVIVLGVLVIVFGKAVIHAAVLLMGICLVLNGLAELNVIRKFW